MGTVACVKEYPHHIHYHIHKATAESIEAGLKENSTIEITEGYTNFEDAFRFFMRYISVNEKDFNEIFPPRQTSLFD